MAVQNSDTKDTSEKLVRKKKAKRWLFTTVTQKIVLKRWLFKKGKKMACENRKDGSKKMVI